MIYICVEKCKKMVDRGDPYSGPGLIRNLHLQPPESEITGSMIDTAMYQKDHCQTYNRSAAEKLIAMHIRIRPGEMKRQASC